MNIVVEHRHDHSLLEVHFKRLYVTDFGLEWVCGAGIIQPINNRHRVLGMLLTTALFAHTSRRWLCSAPTV